jgi:EmrB/QacA subfamily drug resistance transporter
VLAIILAAYLMIVVDISIVITGLPRIQETLGFSDTGLSWVQNAYLLAYGGLLLLGARAGDLLGRRRMFIIGVVVFTTASFAVGTAPSAAWLIAARGVQGVGAAILAPSTLTLLSTRFSEGPERTRALASYGATASVGATLGLVLGGVFADVLSWRIGFLLNVPLGIALIVTAPRYLPETSTRAGDSDLRGAITSTLGMTAIVYGIVRAASVGWAERLAVGALATGIVLLIVFVTNESRTAQPIMPLRLFASRERCGAYAARMLFLGATVSFWFFTTQYLQRVADFSPFATGFAFLPATIANFAGALAVPRLAARLGNARLLAAGLVTTLIGMAWLSRSSETSSYVADVALPMVLIGLGGGATLTPLTAFGIAGVEHEDAGTASGLVNVAHQLGGSLGLGVLVAVFASLHSLATDAKEQLAQRISTALTGAVTMLALALGLVIVLIVRAPSNVHRRTKT